MKQQLDGLMEKTTINFPRHIDAKEAEKILKYVSREEQCGIRYTEKSAVKINDWGCRGDYERYVQEISGTMNRFGVALMLVEFQLFRDSTKQGAPEFDGLRFLTVPGYDLEEISKEEVGFMDKVKKDIAEYFSKRK